MKELLFTKICLPVIISFLWNGIIVVASIIIGILFERSKLVNDMRKKIYKNDILPYPKG